ncbi:trans-sialidase, putative [Trypanosoma cruzi]|uniref:Trans-sialidase, putative n=2 Tax=Trypanosoma cruzi TaxID=5693 RepID=Q4DNP2_TRYCC|nr:trans-sialidase, putative [Trypanosoma cruzi]EAN94150.1 trans-sialidase, putative [Trypanosoma cruzi]|eukprot:XP_816001.1 trans-sialidase [Trypanosoma cruzi strain CL Brener]
MVSLRLTEQLERVKKVLATWKKVDERVSKLCPFKSALEDTPADNGCSAVKITDGLVGFLSGDLSGSTWRDDYLGVNATVMMEEGAEKTENGVTFKGRGAWAEWPVGKQGENQLYHFANYNFTLVTTVSIDGVPKEGDTVPLMGAKMDDDNNNPVLLGLSYNSEKKWILKCSGQTTEKLGSTWEPQTTYQVAIVLQNGTQGSVYVDGQRVGDAQCELENKKDKKISHFYIGGDGGSAGGQGDVSVTVENVLLYNRPLTSEEIAGLTKNTITIPKPEDPKTLVVDTQSPAVIAPDVQVALPRPNSAGQRPLEEEPLTANIGAGGVSSAASVATTPSSDASPTVVTGSGDTMPGNGSPQTPEVSVSSGGHGEKVEGTNGQEEGIHSQVREVNATALSSSLGNVSQGNNTDAGTVCGSGLPLLLLLGLWGFAAL